MGGTCGDLVTALIDPRDSMLQGTTVQHVAERTRLKKPHEFALSTDKDCYMRTLRWHSIPSHDLDYHLSRQHQIIGIQIKSLAAALWAARRFQNLHHPRVWQQMQERCGAKDTDHYAVIMMDFGSWVAQKVARCIDLECILEGRADHELAVRFGIDVSLSARELYRSWLANQSLIVSPET